jgi:hypothetical protein
VSLVSRQVLDPLVRLHVELDVVRLPVPIHQFEGVGSISVEL